VKRSEGLRVADPREFGVELQGDYGFLYGDNGFLPYTDSQVLIFYTYSQRGIYPSLARDLVNKVISGTLGREVTFDTPDADLILHGYSFDREYRTKEDLSDEFLSN